MSSGQSSPTSVLGGVLAAAKAAPRKTRSVLSCCVATALLAVLPNDLHAQSPAPAPKATPDVRIVKSRVLVQPRAGLDNRELDKIVAAHGGRRVEHLRQINVHVIELPARASEAAVINALRGNPHLKFAEPDVVLDPSLYVNDPLFGNQWHLPKIAAPAAWDVRTGTGVTIAILDTGVDPTHPDLVAQFVPGWNTFDKNNNTADVLGHGTMVAGTAVAAGNNSAGVAGVAFGAKLMPIRVTDSAGYAYYSTIANGITWAADKGARVVNISFQGPSASATVLSAAQYMRSKGGVVVNGSGNSGVMESYPPTDYMTLVSGTDSNNNVTSFSSYGSFVDVTAPATSISSTSRGGNYGSGTGTSFSGPVVAGVYALMISANPSLTPTQLDHVLFSTATDILTTGKDAKAGWGVVNASAAVTKAMQTAASDSTAPSVSIGSPSSGAKVNGLVPVSVSATDNIGVQRTELYVNGSLYATDTVTPYAFSVDSTKLTDGNVTLVAKAYDAAGNAGTSAAITVTIANDTTPPVATIGNPADGSTVSGTVTVSASATDDNKVAQISLSIDGQEVALVYGSTLNYAWSPPTKRGKSSKNTMTGSHTLTVTAKDPAGNSGTKSITVKSQ